MKQKSMESRLIYAVAKKIRFKIDWPKVTDTEWIYFGANEETNSGIVIQIINNFFPVDILNVVWTRYGSFQTTKQNILLSVDGLLGMKDFSIWNQSFTHVIEFNHIGVLRCGKLHSS